MPRLPRIAIDPFAVRVVRWHERHGRHDLPWQGTRDPYRIWLSEVMLQQTQVATVVPYYQRFLERFPDVEALARGTEDEVLGLWSGLGYYARARNLHRAAREVVERFGARFPDAYEALVALPGVGRSTAGAIAAFASGERRAILDANVRRVLARHAGIEGDPATAAVLGRLWSEAAARTPAREIERYTQGMMDLGANVCLARRPLCLACPVHEDCVARVGNRVDQLPTPRQRAPRARRATAMLVVVDRGEVLLEKRPARGIWGGLWSLPEVESAERAAAALREGWGLRARRIEALPPFEHAFTHFTLEVRPLRVAVARGGAPRAGSNALWLALSDLPGAALPSPVRKLLQRVMGSAAAA